MALPGDEVLIDLRPDGTAEGIKEKFPPPFYFTAFIDGGKARGKAGLMTEAAAALKFPSYFGRNWDALLDCLRSMPEFNPAGGYVLAVRDSGSFLSESAEEMAVFREVASEAAEFLREKLKVTFKVVFL